MRAAAPIEACDPASDGAAALDVTWRTKQGPLHTFAELARGETVAASPTP